MLRTEMIASRLPPENGHDTTLPISNTDATQTPAETNAGTIARAITPVPRTGITFNPGGTNSPVTSPKLTSNPTAVTPIPSTGAALNAPAPQTYAQLAASLISGGAETGSGSAFESGITETGPAPGGGTLTQGLSSLYFATPETASQLATLLGGSVNTQNPYGTGPVKSSGQQEMITINGQNYNAGLLANELAHGDINASTFANGGQGETGGL